MSQPILLRTPRRRAAVFTLLYASEGAPIGFLWWALPTLLRERQVEVERITGLLALLVLPWTFKFLWAPLVDRVGRPWLWIGACQIAMALSLLPLVRFDATDTDALFTFLILHAVFAATQDVAIDSLAIQVTGATERGRLNAFMQAGMLLGRSAFGGGALLVADRLGWPALIAALAAWILANALLVLGLRPARPTMPAVSTVSNAGKGALATAPGVASTRADADTPVPFVRLLAAAFRRRTTWIGLGFALVSAAAFEAAGALAGPYLVDHGASSRTVGFFFAVPVIAATLAGGFAGGFTADRFGRRRALVAGTLGFVLPILVLAGIEPLYSGVIALPWLLGILTAMYVGVGFFTASSYALFMDWTDARLGATQFSTFMAATNACESWATWAGGRLVKTSGYGTSFAFASLVSLLALPLLALGRGRHERDN